LPTPPPFEYPIVYILAGADAALDGAVDALDGAVDALDGAVDALDGAVDGAALAGWVVAALEHAATTTTTVVSVARARRIPECFMKNPLLL
jgi:hypothetical protein